MKYQTTPAFDADWRRLPHRDRDLFRRVVRDDFHAACERYRGDSSTPRPRGLRVRDVEGAQGFWEMTWSFSGPDGRATFEWVKIDGELELRWRRVGGHDVVERP